MDLGDKVVVITGASRGLGRSLALIFVKERARVVIASNQQDETEKTAAEVGSAPVICDVRKESDIENLARVALAKHGRLDIWINNAGVWLPHAPIEETDWQRVREMFEVNVFGTIYGSKAALKQMRQQQSGIIINILSTSALEGRPGSAGYCASKWAASGFTKSLRGEVSGTGIKVFGIYPDRMQTNLFDEKRPNEIENYLSPDLVAAKIVANLKQSNPEEELIIDSVVK